MALPLHRPLSYVLPYDPPHSDPPEAATRLAAAAQLAAAAPREARPRGRLVTETCPATRALEGVPLALAAARHGSVSECMAGRAAGCAAAGQPRAEVESKGSQVHQPITGQPPIASVEFERAEAARERRGPKRYEPSRSPRRPTYAAARKDVAVALARRGQQQ